MLRLDGDPLFQSASILPVEAASWVDEDRGRRDSFSVRFEAPTGSITFHFSNRAAAEDFHAAYATELAERANVG